MSIDTHNASHEPSYHRIFQSAAVAMALVDLKGRITAANAAMCKLLGYTEPELLARHLNEITEPTDAATTADALQKMLQGEMKSTRIEKRYRRKDGSLVWAEVTSAVVRDDRGAPLCFVAEILDIGERKRVEQTYRTILDTGFDGFYTVDRHGMFRDVNQTYCRLIGYERAELLTMGLADVEAAETAGEIAAHIERILQTGSDRFETLHRTKAGRILTLETSVTFSGWPEQQFFVFVRDITAQRRAEEDLRRRENELRAVFRVLPDLYFRLDSVGTILDYLAGRNENLFLPPGEFLGKHIGELLPPGVASKFEDAVRAVSKTGEIATMEYALPLGDAERDFEARLVPLGGGQMVAVVRDISERKAFEERLRSQSENYEMIFNLVPAQIWLKDRHNRFLRVNRQVERDLGIPVAEFENRPAEELFPGFAKQYFHDDQEVFRSGMPLLGIVEQVTARSGEVRTVISDKIPYRDKAGEIVGLISFVRDITEQQRLQAQLTQAQRLESIGRLAGGVAHDFNNLLTVINGYAQMVFDSLDPREPIQPSVAEILKAGARAAGLTQQLLAFSRRQVMQLKLVNLNRVVEEVGTMLRRVIGEDIRFVTRLDPGLRMVEADPGQIQQVLMNLAVNARDAMPQGGELAVETANALLPADEAGRYPEARPGAFVRLAVCDTGCGMDDETKSRLFEPFFTTKEPGKGTGLGLSTVYGIVKQSGGFLLVRSEPGQGSQFEIYLPPAERDEAPSESKPAALAAHGAETILLVEDQSEVREIAAKALTMYGYTVIEADRGALALEICQRHPGEIHLVIADVVMPDIGGRALAGELVKLRPNMKVLLMSGYTDDVLVRGAASEFAFLGKPFTIDRLASKVREVLGGTKSRQAR